MQKIKMHGLVGDLWPNIRLMQLTGHWLLEYHEETGGMVRVISYTLGLPKEKAKHFTKVDLLLVLKG